MPTLPSIPRLTAFLLFLLAPVLCAAQNFLRLKGYYRVWQTTDSALTYFWDGYMEVYVPLNSTLADGNGFCDRKFLGERRRKAASANGDDLFIQMNLPNLETTPLLSSIAGDEYSTRNNGDIYFLKYKAGHVSRTDSTTTVTVDELAGRPDHRLDMSQLKMYGIVATMTAFDEQETRLAQSGGLLSFGKRTAYFARYRGEDADEKIEVTSEFFVTDSRNVSKAELRKIKKAKNHIWEFNIPTAAPPLPDNVSSAWPQLVEY